MEGNQPQLPAKPVLSSWVGRRWHPDGTDVFCAHDGQPSRLEPPLAETEHFLLVPDAFPVSPGHLLIVPKQHYPCYGAVPARYEQELMSLVAVASGFVERNFGHPMLWENGIAGQSVHHAHLHVIPMPRSVQSLPPPQDAIAIRGLADVRRWFREGRLYHLMWLGNDRRLLPAGSPDVRTASLFKGAVLRVPVTPNGQDWIRERDALSIARTRQLWTREMKGRQAPAGPQIEHGLGA